MRPGHRVCPEARIVFQSRVRFGGAIVHDAWLEGTLWLYRRVEHPRLHRLEPLGGQGYAAHFRLEQPGDIDDALEALVREAYALHRPDVSPR